MGNAVQVRRDDVIDRLKQNWLFGALYPEELDQIADFSEVISFENWETITEKGIKNSAIWIILQGSARLALAKDTNEPIWIDLKESDMFGEMAWLDGFTSSATIQTSSKSLLLKIPHVQLNRFLDANLSVSNLILRKIAIHLAARLRSQSPAR